MQIQIQDSEILIFEILKFKTGKIQEKKGCESGCPYCFLTHFTKLL